ncbi:MAG: hypothetical protein ACR2K5_07820 [Pseudolabrys sp.]
MRAFTTYILAALLFGIVLDFAAAPVGATSNMWPNAESARSVGTQIVNRGAKADRLQITVKRQSTQIKTVREVTPEAAPMVRSVPEGCDAAFSPLSASARLNYASRCLS